MVRILDPADPHHRRLGLVLGEGDDWYEVWIGGHAEDFRHRVARDRTQPVTGTWHSAPDKGEWFVEDRVGN
jgi:hypothetical protein